MMRRQCFRGARRGHRSQGTPTKRTWSPTETSIRPVHFHHQFSKQMQHHATSSATRTRAPLSMENVCADC
ncbi:hypothetical protein M427DRAFT_59861 [Gonapodya prolifera JEL478]|uniref:Uncharacterized protein n=1 Tax=Gonapodya prolifera (strain JEL478) TaxID=1344416 RepID=A0A139A5E6_GONPJ|nr:hypothetical protein M427DRAFT_59861 [Gonapodya prolifera JEL478]|eukprot:KXS11996.1 hypothetical protein M427DRAFT_59861 [Gonapodya prolifera JEL478]